MARAGLPSEMARRYNDETTKDTYRRIISSFCLWLYDDDNDYKSTWIVGSWAEFCLRDSRVRSFKADFCTYVFPG